MSSEYRKMPPKLADKVKRIGVIAPMEWLAKIDGWRRQQPDPMPNLSEAYRRLIEKGLDAEAKAKGKGRHHRD